MNFCYDNERVCRWVIEKAGGHYIKSMVGIGLEKDGVLQVGVVYECFTGSSVLMHSRCDNRKAPTKSFYYMIFYFPFIQLKVKRCTLLVSSANGEALKLNDKLGFTRETVVKDYFPDGDGIVFRMYKEECRFLKESIV